MNGKEVCKREIICPKQSSAHYDATYYYKKIMCIGIRKGVH